MPQQDTIDKFFGAVDDAYDVILDTIKAGSDRGYRISKGLIEQAERGQREALDLAHTIVRSPTDLGKASSAVVETFSNTQGRILETSRQWLDEALDTQQEGREALRRLIDANRQAGEAVVEASRTAFGRAQERARQTVGQSRDGSKAKAGTRSRRKAQSEATNSE